MTEILNKDFILLIDYLFYKHYLLTNNSWQPSLIKFNKILFFESHCNIISSIDYVENNIFSNIIKYINSKDNFEISYDFYNNVFSFILDFYNIKYKNSVDLNKKIKILLNNIEKLDTNLYFYIYWYSLNLFPFKLITLDNLIDNYKKAYELEPNNPYFLFDYARLLWIHLLNITKKEEYIDLSIYYIKRALKISNNKKVKIKWYMLSWLWTAYRHKWNYELALLYINKGILLNKKEKELYELPYYWKIGILWELWKYDDQFRFWELLIKNWFNSFRIYKSFVNSYIKLWKIELAKYNLKKALDVLLNEGLIEIMENNISIFIWYKNNRLKYNIKKILYLIILMI